MIADRFARSLGAMVGCDLMCADPNNGLVVPRPRASPGRTGTNCPPTPSAARAGGLPRATVPVTWIMGRTTDERSIAMRLSHVTIQTSSFAEEIDFYATYARLAIQRDMRPMGANIVFLANAEGDTQIEIIDNPDAADSGNANLSIGFVSEDLDALHAALDADGFRPTGYVSPMPQVRFFFVRDPAGVNVQFM